jgi:hypothetical protein
MYDFSTFFTGSHQLGVPEQRGAASSGRGRGAARYSDSAGTETPDSGREGTCASNTPFALHQRNVFVVCCKELRWLTVDTTAERCLPPAAIVIWRTIHERPNHLSKFVYLLLPPPFFFFWHRWTQINKTFYFS